MQSFTEPQFNEMLKIIEREPEWLGGIVHGPQTRVSVAKLREIVPRRYPIRGYPDITHSMRCEYPFPIGTLRTPLTEGREVINPRPLDESAIFQLYRNNTRGVITYSEGCNDDVNKMIWSSLCWDPNTSTIDILHDYSRYFIGDKYTDDFAEGLLALERNWRGPLRANEDVTTTLQKFRNMERAAEPQHSAQLAVPTGPLPRHVRCLRAPPVDRRNRTRNRGDEGLAKCQADWREESTRWGGVYTRSRRCSNKCRPVGSSSERVSRSTLSKHRHAALG